MTDYSNLSVDELRRLLLSGKLLYEFMAEEDYTALLDIEADYDEPSEQVIDFCFTGLSALPKYDDIDARDFTIGELMQAATKSVPQKHRRLRKATFIAAAVIVLILATQFVASAFGFDLFGYIFNWSKPDVVEIINPDSSTVSGQNSRIEYFAIEDIPLEMKNFIPQYIFENFCFRNALFTNRNGSVKYRFGFIDEEGKDIFFEKSKFENNFIMHIEKDDDGYYEEYLLGNIIYKILTNMGDYHAIWIADDYVYSLSTHFKDINKLKTIIDNLY